MTFAKDLDQRRKKLGEELPKDFKIEESKSSLD